MKNRTISCSILYTSRYAPSPTTSTERHELLLLSLPLLLFELNAPALMSLSKLPPRTNHGFSGLTKLALRHYPYIIYMIPILLFQPLLIFQPIYIFSNFAPPLTGTLFSILYFFSNFIFFCF